MPVTLNKFCSYCGVAIWHTHKTGCPYAPKEQWVVARILANGDRRIYGVRNTEDEANAYRNECAEDASKIAVWQVYKRMTRT